METYGEGGYGDSSDAYGGAALLGGGATPGGSPKLHAEVWRRPGHATFAPVIADIPVISASGTAPVNGVGEGRITIPKSYDRLDEILKPDVATPANAVSSLIRVFSDSSPIPIFEFIPAVFTGEQDKADPDIEIVGPAVDVIWGYSRLEAWDWTGIDDEHSNWPDWIWGGRNILGDLESAYLPAVTKLYREAAVTSGTWILGISFNGGAISNTSSIVYNVTAEGLRVEIVAELTAMGFTTPAVDVSGSGSVADPWRIQTITPEGEYVFSVDSGGLVGGLILQDRETIGVIVPAGWTTSFNPVNNLPHGNVSEFRISTFTSPDPAAPACDTSGFAIMFDGGLGDFPGIQKIVPIKPGGRYYATATSLAQGAGSSYRLVIRDLYEAGIAASPGFTTGTTLAANSWTAFDINVITMPSDRDRIIFRFASVGGNDPPATFVTCLELREGMPPTTWGDILTQLWLDATSDHAGRQVWQIGAGVSNFLTLDFTATLTSAGTAWADPEVSITLKRGQSYLRVLGEAAKMGYEWRIVPNDVTTGTWKLQVYNTGEMGVNQSAVSNGPSIQGGRDVTRRDLRRFLPPATDVAVEAGGQNIARSRNTDAVSALGLIEQYIPNQDLGSLVEAALNAAQAVAVNLSRSQSLSYVLTPTTLDPEPFIAYKGADTLYVLDPPDVPIREARRIKSLGFAYTKDRVEYPVQLESDSYVGVGGIAQSVDFLLKEFKAIREQPDETTDALNFFPFGGTGTPTVVLAAYNATELSKEKADFVCPGTADEGMFNIALGILASVLNDAGQTVSGRIVLTEGDYYLASRIELHYPVHIEGMGWGQTLLHSQVTAGSTTPINDTMFWIDHTVITSQNGHYIFSKMHMNGHKAIQTSGGPAGLYVEANGSSTIDLFEVDIEGFRGYGAQFDRCADNVTAYRCRFRSNTAGGVNILREGVFKFTNCEANGNSGHGFEANGAFIILTGCDVFSNTLDGFSSGGILQQAGQIIKGNRFYLNRNGIALDGYEAIIEGNIFWANTAGGISVAANLPMNVNDNVCYANGTFGILLGGGDGQRGGNCIGNIVELNGTHGIDINGQQWNVQQNHVTNNSRTTTNTYDGIKLTGGTNIAILNNYIRQTTGAPVQRYGINITAAAVNAFVAGNDARGGGFGTAAFVDAGTASVLAWAGAFGDNQP